MRSNTLLTILFVLVIGAVLIGEAYVYTIDNGRYSSSLQPATGGLDYSVTSGGSECYSIVVSDNGNFEKIEKYYIYYDEGRGSMLEKVPVPIGAKELTQEYYISQLIKTLNNRGVCDIEMLNAEGVRGMCTYTMSTSTESSNGLIVLSGALPDTVYSDTEDLIIDWIKKGGSLYWAGNTIGAYCSAADGSVAEVTRNYELDLFGMSDCLNTGDENTELCDVTDNNYRYSLSLMNNRVRYGVDTSGLAAGTFLAAGYTDGTYCSAVMVKLGDGMICVLAGDHSNEQRHDLAQIIASGICYASEEIGYVSGDVKRGTVSGHIEINGGAGFTAGVNYTAYVHYGGYYTVYGKSERWTQ